MLLSSLNGMYKYVASVRLYTHSSNPQDISKLHHPYAY